MFRKIPLMIPGYWCSNDRLHPWRPECDFASRAARHSGGACAECEALDRRVELAAQDFVAAVSSRLERQVVARASGVLFECEELSEARQAVDADVDARASVVRRPSYDEAVRALDPDDVAVVAMVLARPHADISVVGHRLDRSRQEVYRAVQRALDAGLLLSTPRGQR